MDAQQFLAEFGHIANAPGGVARLREMVLALAVSGRLIERPEINESLAADFLRKLEQELADYKAANKYRRTSGDRDAASTLKVPAPPGWINARLGQIGVLIRGVTYNKAVACASNGQGMTGLLRANNIGANVSFDDLVYVPSDLVDKEQILCAGDVLIAMSSGSKDLVGKAAIVLEDSEFGFGAFCGAFRPMPSLRREFIRVVMQSPQYRDYVSDQGKGIGINNLTKGHIEDYEFFLPPPEEQSRIVAKVDELMALCDTLEAQQQARRKLQNKLRQSTLQAVASATGPHKLQTTWARLADNFGRLFHVPEDVTDLRQLAMDLAVRGLLTEQRDNDEPASELISRIALGHKELVLSGEMKRPKPLPEIDLADAPFELPRGWAWARFPEVGLFGRGKSKHRPRNDPKLFTPGIYPLVQTGEVARANSVIREYHSKYSDIGLAQSKLWPKGTLCITIAANIADAAILGFDACFPDSVVGFIPAFEIRDEVEYFLLFMKTARERLLAFAPSTAQKNINLEILQSVLIPIPPKDEIKRILSRINEINALCDQLANTRKKAQEIGKLLAGASISSVTGIATEEEEPMKAPQTELIAPLPARPD